MKSNQIWKVYIINLLLNVWLPYCGVRSNHIGNPCYRLVVLKCSGPGTLHMASYSRSGAVAASIQTTKHLWLSCQTVGLEKKHGQEMSRDCAPHFYTFQPRCPQRKRPRPTAQRPVCLTQSFSMSKTKHENSEHLLRPRHQGESLSVLALCLSGQVMLYPKLHLFLFFFLLTGRVQQPPQTALRHTFGSRTTSWEPRL